MKIGLIIPVTSNKRNWKTIEETYLYNYTLKTFLLKRLRYSKPVPNAYLRWVTYSG